LHALNVPPRAARHRLLLPKEATTHSFFMIFSFFGEDLFAECVFFPPDTRTSGPQFRIRPSRLLGLGGG
jgi:hypothetical protein